MDEVKINELLDLDLNMEDLNEEDKENDEQLRELQAQKREIENRIRLLKHPGSKLSEGARLVKDDTKNVWRICIRIGYYVQQREKGEKWYSYHNREYTERRERWLPIIEEKTREEALARIDRTIKGLQQLKKETKEE